MKIDFLSPRPIIECRQLLAEALAERLVGRVKGDRFELSIPAAWYGTITVEGQFDAEPPGTRVQARFESPGRTPVGIALWSLLAAAIALVLSITRGYQPGVILFALVVSGFAAIPLTQRAKRQDGERVANLLTALLTAGRMPDLSAGLRAAKRVELAIDIQASPGDIWAVLTDPVGFTEWVRGMQSVEVLTAGEYGVGTRYHVIAGTGQRTIEWTVEITGLEPERRIDFSYSGAVEGNGGWLIEPDKDGVRYWVTSFDEFAPPGSRLMKLLSRFWLDNAARAARRESLERLKDMVESTGEDEAEYE